MRQPIKTKASATKQKAAKESLIEEMLTPTKTKTTTKTTLKVKESFLPKKRQSKFILRFIGWSLAREKEFLLENLSMLLGAGMDVVPALKSIAGEIKSPLLRKIILEIRDDVASGIPIHQALESSKLFPLYIVSLIQVGEETGKLNEKLHVISVQQKKSRTLKATVKSSLSYPILIVILALVVGIGVSIFILPRFVSIFSLMNKELPFLTQQMLNLGTFFVNYGILIVPLLIGLLTLGIYFIFFFRRTKFIGQWILFHISATRRVMQEIELSRLGYNFGLLLEAGLPIVQSLEALIRSTSFYNYKKLYTHLRDSIRDGQSFNESFESFKNSRKLIPLPIQQMIASGESSGSLDDSLNNIGNIYEVKVDSSAKALTTMIEPVLLIIIGLGIMALALAIITPIYNLIDDISI
jgi:type IV pilus assembly protein PilC